jgi:hypothetical protein
MSLYHPLSHELSRRSFVENIARATLGVSVVGGWQHPALAKTGPATADHCILLMMTGGMPHLDTFDPKPDKSEVMGPTQVVKTALTGERFAATVPQLAKLADKLTVIRSMYQRTADHRQATYTMRTSYPPIPTIVHPSLGPWAQRLLGKKNDTLPDSVTIGAGVAHPGAGFMPPAFSPMPIDAADKGVPNMKPYGFSYSGDAMKRYETILARRLDLTEKLDEAFRAGVTHEKVRGYTEFYDETLKFLRSKDLKLFDLAEEKEKDRERYGQNSFGQGCLLAKRLVKGGVRFVEVTHGSWDTHVDNFDKVATLAGTMDRAVANLIADLDAEGLLERTMVVLATEFGRTPKINGNSGRDHHSVAFSCVLAGGGARHGHIIGRSDATGDRLETDPFEPKHLNATIARALGMNLEEIITSPSGRPFTVATHRMDGQKVVTPSPIMEVFG